MKLLILNGPNLNLLGERNPDLYGAQTLDELNRHLEEYAQTRYPDLELDFFQSNCEGALMDALHRIRHSHDGVVFNPGAYAHYSYALRDAIEAIGLPVVEVHLSDIAVREDFRRVSVVRPVCAAHFQGEGQGSYERAVDYLCTLQA